MYRYFSHNGTVQPVEEAVIPLSRIEYTYGFGVYETIRYVHGAPLFLDDHLERLMGSAEGIGLEHEFTVSKIEGWIKELANKNEVDACNMKLLLVGGPTPSEATLSIQCLAPHFPDRKLYKKGAHAITVEMERPFPQSKSLSMLPSYIAYREANAAGAYDALILNRDGYIIEGTRTNFFVMKGRVLYTPPEEEILLGVTRKHVLKAALENGYTLETRSVKPEDLGEYDAAFITSTSSKIMPLQSIDTHSFGAPHADLAQLLVLFQAYLKLQ